MICDEESINNEKNSNDKKLEIPKSFNVSYLKNGFRFNTTLFNIENIYNNEYISDINNKTLDLYDFTDILIRNEYSIDFEEIKKDNTLHKLIYDKDIENIKKLLKCNVE